MKITLNPDKSIVDALKNKMKENGGYCPCRLVKNEDTKCICKEFREQMKDENFEGYCYCGLYYKSKQ